MDHKWKLYLLAKYILSNILPTHCAQLHIHINAKSSLRIFRFNNPRVTIIPFEWVFYWHHLHDEYDSEPWKRRDIFLCCFSYTDDPTHSWPMINSFSRVIFFVNFKSSKRALFNFISLLDMLGFLRWWRTKTFRARRNRWICSYLRFKYRMKSWPDTGQWSWRQTPIFDLNMWWPYGHDLTRQTSQTGGLTVPVPRRTHLADQTDLQSALVLPGCHSPPFAS